MIRLHNLSTPLAIILQVFSPLLFCDQRISHDKDNGPSRKRRKKTSTNARFDRMMETMSVVNPSPMLRGDSTKTRHGRKARVQSANDAPAPPLSTTLGSQLSFIKMDRLPISDDEHTFRDNATNKTSKSSSSRRTCNPLPVWLADTFRSLAKKHPLRLLLPPGDQLITSEHKQPAPQQEDLEDTFSFKLPIPSPTIDQETNFEDSPGPDFSLLAEPFFDENSAYIKDIPCSRVAERIPFSTPGPGLGSSTIVVSPKTASSPTIWTDFHSDSDLRLAVPHITSNSSDTGDFKDDCAPNDSDFYEWNALPPDLAVASPFSEIYARPGPTYYASRVLHFDSPTEEPRSDDETEHNKFGTLSADAIDFHWEAFDRKDVGGHTKSKPVSFAYGPGETFDSILRDSINLDENAIDPGPERFRGTIPNILSSPSPPVSPNPFRFFPPLESRQGCPNPHFQELSQNSTESQKQPSQPVPGEARRDL